VTTTKLSKYEQYLIYDKPIPIKDLLIYPARLSEYIEFNYCVQCLLLDKNCIPDIKIISMNYLEYLIYLYDSGDKKEYLYMLDMLFRLVLHRPESNFSWGKSKETKRGIFVIDEKVYDGSDFDELRQIICLQNSVELPDENIQKEIRDKMDEARKLRQKLSSSKPASFEELMVCILISTGLKTEDIYNLTIRKFQKILERLDAKLHYEIYLSASLSGMVEFKDKSFIKHWMTDLSTGKNDDVFIGVESMENKLSLEDKKIK
jgi:hypothetical protein